MIMSQTIEIILDEQNRLIIPTLLQNRLYLKQGMQLMVEVDEQGRLYLRLPVNLPKVVNKAGILVVQAELVGDIETAVENQREQRTQTVGEMGML